MTKLVLTPGRLQEVLQKYKIASSNFLKMSFREHVRKAEVEAYEIAEQNLLQVIRELGQKIADCNDPPIDQHPSDRIELIDTVLGIKEVEESEEKEREQSS